MHDGMPYDSIRGQDQGRECLETRATISPAWD